MGDEELAGTRDAPRQWGMDRVGGLDPADKAVAHAQLPHVDETTRQKIDREIDAGVNAEDLAATPVHRRAGAAAATSEPPAGA